LNLLNFLRSALCEFLEVSSDKVERTLEEPFKLLKPLKPLKPLKLLKPFKSLQHFNISMFPPSCIAPQQQMTQYSDAAIINKVSTSKISCLFIFSFAPATRTVNATALRRKAGAKVRRFPELD